MEVVDLVVGTPECPINTVASILREDVHLKDNWSSLAMGLGISSVGIKTLQNDLRLDKMSYSDVIYELLEKWVTMKSSHARLLVLILVLDGDCGAIDATKCLGRYFNLSESFYGSMSWMDLTTALEVKVVRNIHTYFPSMDIESVKPMLNGRLLLHLMREKSPDTLPESISYYVNRSVRTKNIISTKILENCQSDILLISGIQRHELSRFAKDMITDHSTNQIRQGSITVKHMILDSPAHFDKICKLAGDKQHVHYIRFVDKKLQWIRSSGGISLMHDYMDKEQIDLNEDDFYEQLDPNSNSPVCISDGPGMGKSIFLAQMGRRLKTLFPERTVIFLVLGEVIKQIRQTHFDDLLQSLMKSDKERPSSLSIELLLDGLDEVDSTDLEFALDLLCQISTCQSIRLWVTTRLHLLHKLEVNLNTIGFHINPFSVDDQTRFLTSYWLNNISSSENAVKEKLSKFANHCLTTLKSTMKSKESDIAGVPLQCLLIGEVYAEEAEVYGTAENSAFPLLLISSVTDLYEALIARKFKKCLTTDTEKLMEMHAALSMELIFPKMFTKCKHLFGPVDTADMIRAGVIESSGTTGASRFLHRTFAEYFVAWWVVHGLILGKHEEEPFLDFFFNEILHTNSWSNTSSMENYSKTPNPGHYEFTFSVIVYFLNSVIAKVRHMSELPANNFINQLQSHSINFPDSIVAIALATAQADYLHLQKFLFDINAFDKLKEWIFDHELLFCTFNYSSLPFIKFGLSQFEKSHTFDARQVQAEALRLACERGEFSIVEFLINDRKLRWMVEKIEHNSLMFDCLTFSSRNSALVVDNKIQLVQFLLEINPSLLEIKGKYGETPLVAEEVHYRLITELLRLGANAMAVNTDNQTVLHLEHILKNISSSEYHQLISSIPEDSLRAIVKVVDCSGYKDTPLCALLRNLPDPALETLDLFKSAGADFNQVSEDEDEMSASAVSLSVQNGGSGRTIRKLISLGANVRWKHPWVRQSLLHYAAENGNKEAVAVLVEYLSVNITNIAFMTPMDTAVEANKEREFIEGLAMAGRSTENVKCNGKRKKFLFGLVKLLGSDSE